MAARARAPAPTPTPPPQPLLTGYLSQEHRLTSICPDWSLRGQPVHWHKRWFVLSGGRHPQLTIYDNDADERTQKLPRATIDLSAAHVGKPKKPRRTQPHAIRVVHGKGKKLIVAASSVDEVERWVAAFNACGLHVMKDGWQPLADTSSDSSSSETDESSSRSDPQGKGARAHPPTAAARTLRLGPRDARLIGRPRMLPQAADHPGERVASGRRDQRA